MRRTFVLSVATALMATIVLVVTGVILSSVYRNSVERAFDGRLMAYMKMLVANLISADQRLEGLPHSISEPLFDLPLSGWYWRVGALDKQDAGEQTSRSLWGRALPHVSSSTTDARASSERGYVPGPENLRLRMVEHIVDFGDRGRFQVAVAGDASEIDNEMRSFHGAIAISFSFLTILVALMMFFQKRLMHIGLALRAPLEGT
jgi:hypothetical protein